MDVIELDPRLVVPGVLPDEDAYGTYVRDDFLYYCGLLPRLPAISVRVEADRVVSTARHVYLLAAQELGRASIRAAVDPTSDPRAVRRLLEQQNVRSVDWHAEDTKERTEPYPLQPYVFVFERELSPRERSKFEERVIGFFVRLASGRSAGTGQQADTMVPQYEGARVTFWARVPLYDESWYGPSLAVLRAFSHEVVRIVSFRGRKWEAYDLSAANRRQSTPETRT